MGTFLHLGISYCWPNYLTPEDPPVEIVETGHLIVVKNRLPRRCQAQPVRPLLVEDELRGGACAFEDEAHASRWTGMTTDELGPCGCCDCCHAHGLNCGRKFPHGSFVGYLCLSPQWCSSLMRLGYDVSEEAVEYVTNVEPPAAA